MLKFTLNKKIVIGLLLLLSLTACGGSESGSTPTQGSVTSPPTTGGSTTTGSVTMTQIGNYSIISESMRAFETTIENGSATAATFILPDNLSEAKIVFSPDSSKNIGSDGKVSFDASTKFELHLASTIGQNVAVGIQDVTIDGTVVEVNQTFEVIFDDPAEADQGNITFDFKIISTDVKANTQQAQQVPNGQFAAQLYFDSCKVHTWKQNDSAEYVDQGETDIVVEEGLYRSRELTGYYNTSFICTRTMVDHEISFISNSTYEYELQKNGNVVISVQLRPKNVTAEKIGQMRDVIESTPDGDLIDVNLFHLFGINTLYIFMPSDVLTAQLNSTLAINIDFFLLTQEETPRVQHIVNKYANLAFSQVGVSFDISPNDDTEYDLPLIIPAGNSMLNIDISNWNEVGEFTYESRFYGSSLNGSFNGVGALKINVTN